MARYKSKDSSAKNNSMTVKYDDLLEWQAVTKNQEYAVAAWDEGDHLALNGTAGTGKTFIAMYLALEEILSKEYPANKLVIFRSVVPVREIGFLPGTAEEKVEAYTAPYKAICSEIFGDAGSYNKLVNSNQILFEPTSFVRGMTYSSSVSK